MTKKQGAQLRALICNLDQRQFNTLVVETRMLLHDALRVLTEDDAADADQELADECLRRSLSVLFTARR